MIKKGFFKEYWAIHDLELSNYGDKRWRVCDDLTGLEKWFLDIGTGNANGLILIKTDLDVDTIEEAQLYLEMWGGHPKTYNKKFMVNGRGSYAIKDNLTELGHCTYHYKTIDFRSYHLVKGTNALQFSCERGDCFMAHYMIDNTAIRTYIDKEHDLVKKDNLSELKAQIIIEGGNTIEEKATLILDIDEKYKSQIESIDYFGCYEDYNENMEGNYGFKYYTENKKLKGHIGTTYNNNTKIVWDTKWIPDQNREMAVMACVNFKNGIKYATDITYGIKFSENRPSVIMCHINELPIPFWSRDKDLKEAIISLPELQDYYEALLIVKNWDGGEGEIKEYFKINEKHYKIASEKAIHRLVYTNKEINIRDLKSGDNKIELLSDTKHHGMELSWPGPAIKIRLNKS